jgi:16S rRNA (cytosine967-C5)-methyltransferase
VFIEPFVSLLWALAIESLSWIELERLNEDAAIRKTVKQLKIYDKMLVAEARKLIYETVRRMNAINFLVNKALEPNNLRNLRIGLRSFLRLYTYLVHYSGDSHARAYELVDHAIDLIGKRDFNQVKDAPDVIPAMAIPFDEISDTQRFAYKYFHPSWYVAHLFSEFDEYTTEKLIEYTDYPSYVRLNRVKGSSDLPDNLFEAGYKLVSEPFLRDTYRLLDEEGVTETAEYRNGGFIIQDKASILVGEVADPKPDDVVLDVCAAPGVKTSHMAQLMENTGLILSVDYSRRRLQSWGALMKRLGVTNAKPVQADASKPGTLPMIDFDIVLVDPPCTSTGLFHKIPSSKWRLSSRSVDNMARLQKRILLNSAQCLREEGTLVYSTCSITVEENEEVVQSFLDRMPEFSLVESSPRLGEPGLRGMKEAQRLYPYKHSCNGFFVAKLVKNVCKS